MTTQVTIRKTDEVNHHDLLIKVLSDGVLSSSHRLTDEGCFKEYIYDNQTLSICEIEKEVSEDLVETEEPESDSTS